MADLDSTLDQIAANRAADPLAVTTVIVPSRLSALQMRRRLAARGAFAGVRFEPLARLAELIAASTLARSKLKPLARPIADYVATRIARESQAPLSGVREIPGYARALRQTFRRLRRGGFHNGAELLEAGGGGASLTEIARLYSRFREDTANFYDDEDLMEAAADVLKGNPGRVLPELGSVYVVPPVRLTAASSRFLDVISEVCETFTEVDEPQGRPEEHFIMAPDSASEVRGVVKSVIDDLAAGLRLDEIAVFYSGDRAYRPLLDQAFEAAKLPASSMPGTPLIETTAGRGALSLVRLALEDYSRVAVFDFLGLAPLKPFVPTAAGERRLETTSWQRIAVEAGVTKTIERWRRSLDVFANDQQVALDDQSDGPEWRKQRAQRNLRNAGQLRDVIEALHGALDPLTKSQPAVNFIPPLKHLIATWFDAEAPGLERVLNEVDQLGTIDAVQGSFDLASFVDAFEANLTLAAIRDRPLAEGLLIADHRQAAGLKFKRVYLCGAYEGALPAIATSEPLIQDEDWARLRQTHPYIEDLELRAERSKQAVQRVTAIAGKLVWSAPTQAAGATREYYPSSLMTVAARLRDSTITSASELRTARSSDWLTQLPSPLSAMLGGTTVDPWELRLRETVQMKSSGGSLLMHPLQPAVGLIQARRSSSFTAFDGNLNALDGRAAPQLGGSISPSALETFATCGMRYYFGYVLRIRPVDDPEESQTMGAAEKGSLVHRVLQRFFQEQHAEGRPKLNEHWDANDEARLLEIFEEEFEHVRQQGRAGLDIYMDHDRSVMRADVATFLGKDSEYRLTEGVVPAEFEPRLSAAAPDGLTFNGYIDRLDRSPDGKKAIIIDYKTGRSGSYKLTDEDPFVGGTKLQLPIYALAASDAEVVRAMYWFISSAADFEQVDYLEDAGRRESFKSTVQAILTAMRQGAFPAVPGDENDFYNSFDNCRYCDFTRICSRRRVYESQAKADDPDILAWFDVAETARSRTDP